MCSIIPEVSFVNSIRVVFIKNAIVIYMIDVIRTL